MLLGVGEVRPPCLRGGSGDGRPPVVGTPDRRAYEHVVWPYEAFYVYLPDCDWPLWGGLSGWHRCSGAIVFHEHPESTSGQEFGIFGWGPPNGKSTGPGDDTFVWMPFSREAAWGGDLETYLEWKSDHRKDDPIITSFPPDGKLLQLETENKLARLVVNLLLYLGSRDPDLRSKPPRAFEEASRSMGRTGNPKKAARRLHAVLETPSVVTTVVGRSYEGVLRHRTAGPGSRQAPRAHWRRAHWNTYWMGPRTDEHGNPIQQHRELKLITAGVVAGSKPERDLLQEQGPVHRHIVR